MGEKEKKEESPGDKYSNYQTVEEVGRGAFGVVYKVRSNVPKKQF